MSRSRIGFAVLVLLSASSAFASPSDSSGLISLFEIRRPDGTGVEYPVPKKRLLEAPGWTPGQGEPPLTIGQAVEIAEKQASDIPRERIQVTQISLATRLAPDNTYRWYYSIEFYDRGKLGEALPPTLSRVVVLLDGSVVNPVESH